MIHDGGIGKYMEASTALGYMDVASSTILHSLSCTIVGNAKEDNPASPKSLGSYSLGLFRHTLKTPECLQPGDFDHFIIIIH